SASRGVPASSTPSTGSATLYANLETGALDADVFVQGLVTADAITGVTLLAGSAGTNGAPVVSVAKPNFIVDGGGLRLTVTGLTLPEDHSGDLVNANTYIVVQTASNPSGWIAGQVHLQPTAALTLSGYNVYPAINTNTT